jgi:hypothetical protein
MTGATGRTGQIPRVLSCPVRPVPDAGQTGHLSGISVLSATVP